MNTSPRYFGISILIAAFVLSYSPSMFAATLWAGDENGNLIMVDTVTGAGTPVGQETMFPLSTEIEFDAISGTLYSDEVNGFTNLHTIDPATGQSTGFVSHGCCAYTGMEFVGPTLYVTNINPSLNSNTEVDPGDDFNPDGGAPILLEIVDPATGNNTTIGPTGTPPISGLAYDVDTNIMYGVTAGGGGGEGGPGPGPANLVTVNLGTGVATILFPLIDVTGAPLTAVGSIEFADDGELYGAVAAQGSINPGWLFSIDIGTGSVSFIGPTGLQSITGLTNPEGGVPDFARFLVSKVFNDNNQAEVDVTLSCNTGLPLEQTIGVSEDDPVNFVVGDFEQGTLDCEITEEVPDGYTASYDDGSVSATNCSWEDLEGGQYACIISNNLDLVEVEVDKVWIDENPQFEAINIAEAYWSCSNVAFGSSSGYLDFYGNPGEDSFFVYPDWDTGTTCSVTEINVPDGGVEVDGSDCASIAVSPGAGGSCTIYNTRLYEGIPTLSQYGLAVLALLMLGMGFVAYRRLI